MSFDIAAYKKQHGTHDLEVVIAPDGGIAYAIPSHQEYMIARAQEAMQLSREDLEEACPEAFYANYLHWLHMVNGGFLPVWEIFVLDVEVTPAQYAALRTLKLNGLYKGKLPKIHLSACPICGAEAELSAVKPDRASKASYKYNCSNTALHVSCGDWFNTKLKAQQDWERRCTGYGQPEFYKPTNEEHIRSIIRRNSGAQLIDAIRDIYKPISAYSSREAAARWLAMRYVPDKCVGCAKNQREYCICTKEENQK